jgi:hypothetical protein
MAEHFRVGEIVEVIDTRETRAASEAGRRGLVAQVRRYPDGSYLYSLGWFADGEMGGLYPEHWLAAIGQRNLPAGCAVSTKPRLARSTRVSVAGEVTGEEEYVILEEIKD